MKKILVFLFVLVFGLGALNAEEYDYKNAKPENIKLTYAKYVYYRIINFGDDEYDFYSPELNFLDELNSAVGNWPDGRRLEQGNGGIGVKSVNDMRFIKLPSGNIQVSFQNYDKISTIELDIFCLNDISMRDGHGCFIDDIIEYNEFTKKFESAKQDYINYAKQDKEILKFLKTFKFAN
ncbi:hypothetical protein O6B72_03325 [Campylobacter ureolyticus]|uniref:hypothetical protein n=1 Tax=Campylobacter ureolyticus TaxID=827 RepID=UPI0022B31B7C|nr:hypothetical protein [Campylobacter ureolyticus]MCZ6155847.1 hypothetical protein [Campylobacter ureolyticus]